MGEIVVAVHLCRYANVDGVADVAGKIMAEIAVGVSGHAGGHEGDTTPSSFEIALADLDAGLQSDGVSGCEWVESYGWDSRDERRDRMMIQGPTTQRGSSMGRDCTYRTQSFRCCGLVDDLSS